MADKLLPCPFCGGEASITELTYPMKHYTVICSNEKCYAQMGDFLSKEEAIRMWNTRPNPWHTGTPTEEGDYLLVLKAPQGKPHYFPNTLKKGKKWRYVFRGAIIAYQKIEPYKEKEDGQI